MGTFILYQLLVDCMLLIGNKRLGGNIFSPFDKISIKILSCRAIIGITEETESCHIVKATLEAVCYQARDILGAMNSDYGSHLSVLQVNRYHFSIYSFGTIIYRLMVV